MRSFFTIAWCLMVLPVGGFGGEEASVEIVEKIDQYDFEKSDNTCGPTSMLMMFQSGTPDMRKAYGELLGDTAMKKLNYSLDRFFKNRRSTLSSSFTRWDGKGVQPVDLELSVREWADEGGVKNVTLEGGFLDREEEDTRDSQFVRRIHRKILNSIEAGVPPVLNLRAFIARADPKKPTEFSWQASSHHFVVIRAVQKELVIGSREEQLVSSCGFSATIVDPVAGMESGIYLYSDQQGQPFTALKGNEIKGEWLSGRPFLQVTAPAVLSMRPRHAKFHERVVVIANFLIGAK